MNKRLEILQTELAAGDPALQELLQRLHRLDRAVWRMELLKRDDSMLEHLSGHEQPGIVSVDEQTPTHVARRLTTALADMVDKLEQHVNWVMQAMNRWCLSVLALEVGILILIAAAVMVLATLSGNAPAWSVLQGWWAELLARPISLTVYSVLLLFTAALVHFHLRKKMARRIAQHLGRVEPFDTPRAFMKNTRLRHSIFRPQPVGWAGRTQQQVNELRKHLTDQLAHTSAAE